MLRALFHHRRLNRARIIMLHDVLVVTAALPLAVMLRENRWLEPERFGALLPSMPLMLVAAIAAALVVATHRALWRRVTSFEILTLGQFAALAIMVFYLGQFLIDRLDELPRSAPVIQFLVAMFMLLGSRLAYDALQAWRGAPRAVGDGEGPTLLVGAGDGAALAIEMLRGRDHVVGILCDDVGPHRMLNGVPTLGRLDDLDAVLARLRVQGMWPGRIIVTRAHHELGRAAVYRLMERAHDARIKVQQLPDVLRIAGDPIGSGGVADVLGDAGETEAKLRVIAKRVFDMAVAACGLVVLAPVLLATALAVAFGIQRPVFFVQIRPGRHRRPYKLLKFRTMRDPVDASGRLLCDDERTPLIGRFLRRTRLDELPQFWNVLVGDMALIGPRPLMADELDGMPDGGRARSRVRPGITGWAQVNGGQQLTVEEKLALDLWYASHASLRLDLEIIVRTIAMVIWGERRSPAAIDLARATGSPAAAGAGD